MHRNRPVIVIGAGASKAAGSRLTSEILDAGYRSISKMPAYTEATSLLDDFLVREFQVPKDEEKRENSDYPSLTLLLGLVDTAINRNQPFGPRWSLDNVRRVRHAIEAVTYHALAPSEPEREALKPDLYLKMLNKVYQEKCSEPIVISLNYDSLIDVGVALFNNGPKRDGEPFALPDYMCDIQGPAFKTFSATPSGKLLKLHGSLNWLYCPMCHLLDLRVSPLGEKFVPALKGISKEAPLETIYSFDGVKCRQCHDRAHPVMIAPTHLKDYRNPHLNRVWYHAERFLHEAEKVYFIGYSLPDTDVDVMYLLKRGLAGFEGGDPIRPKNIVVVNKIGANKAARTPQARNNSEVGRRYQALFGRDLEWHPEGFEEWVAS